MGPLHDRYIDLAQGSELELDRIQLQALQSLERLRYDLMTNKPPPKDLCLDAQTELKRGGAGNDSTVLSSWTSSWMSNMNKNLMMSLYTSIRGVYLHGGVGCGKTFLMNQIFHDSILDGPWKDERQKTHFHKFMLRIHSEMHSARYNDHIEGDAIIPAVVKKVIQGGRLLCFDEFQVTDVADALILQRLFTGLWSHGCVVVATSNRPPEDLYLNGLQRDRFVPFINVLQQRCEIVSMWESETDYRLVLKGMDDNDGNPQDDTNSHSVGSKKRNRYRKVFYQGGKETRKDFDRLFYEMVGQAAVSPTSLSTQGRRVAIPQAALAKGIARFTFEDLCKKALGAADYLVIGQTFHTVFVENIPILTLAHLNWVRRFITFVDAMYESHCKLILQAKTDVRHIFQPGAHTQDDEVFAFDRTISRLEEMSSQSYLQKQQRPDNDSGSIESKAALLSQRKAVINVIPSLGDSFGISKGL